MSDRDRGLHRHGDLDPSKWDEVEVKPHLIKVSEPSTLGSRAAARKGTKQPEPEEAEDQPVTRARTKKAGAR